MPRPSPFAGHSLERFGYSFHPPQFIYSFIVVHREIDYYFIYLSIYLERFEKEAQKRDMSTF